MPPEEERYALSQQMIVLKIQRLQARERSMNKRRGGRGSGAPGGRAALGPRQLRLSARRPRGGRGSRGGAIERDRRRPAAEHGAARHQRRDRSYDPRRAGARRRRARACLAARAAAVDALQRAFGRSRYLLRSLASRSRLDPSRRLTGNVSSADVVAAGHCPTPTLARGHARTQLLAACSTPHQRLSTGPPSRFGLPGRSRRSPIDPAAERWHDGLRATKIKRAAREKTPASTRHRRPRRAGRQGTGAGLAGLYGADRLLEQAWREGDGGDPRLSRPRPSSGLAPLFDPVLRRPASGAVAHRLRLPPAGEPGHREAFDDGAECSRRLAIP